VRLQSSTSVPLPHETTTSLLKGLLAVSFLTSELQLYRKLYVARSATSKEWIAKPYVRSNGDW